MCISTYVFCFSHLFRPLAVQAGGVQAVAAFLGDHLKIEAPGIPQALEELVANKDLADVTGASILWLKGLFLRVLTNVGLGTCRVGYSKFHHKRYGS